MLSQIFLLFQFGVNFPKYTSQNNDISISDRSSIEDLLHGNLFWIPNFNGGLCQSVSELSD